LESMGIKMDFSFYKGKKVLVTGNTGFKGSWLTYWLLKIGAEVVGYALEPLENPNSYELLGLKKYVKTYYNDIRDYGCLQKCFAAEKPEIVIHLAAQPLVRESYKNPRYTYECNVMGTVNVMECIRNTDSVKSFLNVTTDKVYRNNEWEWGYRENDILDGYDPYSNSKSCSELVTASYIRSFGKEMATAISTARAGNVIGGGDFSKDRIIPDCLRAAEQNKDIFVRNPNSVRPYQHVLEPLGAYLMIAQAQYENAALASNYNVGPEFSDCVTTGELASIFCEIWGKGLSWYTTQADGPHEAGFLSLDCSKIKKTLGWESKWHIKRALEKTIEWHQAYLFKEDIEKITSIQIDEFMA